MTDFSQDALAVSIRLIVNMSAQLGTITNRLEGMKGKLGETSKAGEDSFAKMKAAGLQLGIALGVVTGAAVAFNKAMEFGGAGANLLRVEAAGQQLAKGLGGNLDLIVQKLDAASLGTVAKSDIILAANRAMMLGLGADADKLANLMQVAAFRGRAMGISTTQAFSDIVTGVGRMSPMILDNLGIVVDADKTYGAYAATIGKTAAELTSAEKRQALLSRVLEEGNSQLKAAGGLLDDTAGQYERLEASQKNFSDAWKAFSAPYLAFLADEAAGILKVGEAQTQVGRNLRQEAIERGRAAREVVVGSDQAYDAAERAAVAAYAAGHSMAEAYGDAKNALEAYQGALERAKAGMEAWGQIGQVATAQADRYFTRGSDGWKQIQGAIDAATGSTEVAQYQLEQTLSIATRDFRRGKISLDEYNDILLKIGEDKGLKPFGTYEKSAEDATSKIDFLKQAIDNIPAHTFKWIHIITTGTGLNFNAGMSTADYEALQLQGGRAGGGPAYHDRVTEVGEGGGGAGSEGLFPTRNGFYVMPHDRWTQWKQRNRPGRHMRLGGEVEDVYVPGTPTTPYPGWNPMDWTRAASETMGGGPAPAGGMTGPSPSTSAQDSALADALMQQVLSTLADLPKAVAFTLRDVLQSQSSSIRS